MTSRRNLFGLFSKPEAANGRPLAFETTHHSSGVTIAFLHSDAHERGRRRAWLFFEIGIGVLIATIIAFAAFATFQVQEFILVAVFLGMPFVYGLIMLVMAANKAIDVWEDHDEISLLEVTGGLLIRTARNREKQIWSMDAIADFAILESENKNNEATLVLIADSGEKITLLHGACTSVEDVLSELHAGLQSGRRGLNKQGDTRTAFRSKREGDTGITN
jgi:hypothetical protein